MSSDREVRHQELRCFCSRSPLLATYGIDKNNKLFIHVRIFKQRRIFGEVFITDGGTVQLRCRECLRVHTVVIRQPNRVELIESEPPVPSADDPADPVLAPVPHDT